MMKIIRILVLFFALPSMASAADCWQQKITKLYIENNPPTWQEVIVDHYVAGQQPEWQETTRDLFLENQNLVWQGYYKTNKR